MPLDIVLFAILYSEGPYSLYTASPPWTKIGKKVQFIEASKAKINVFIFFFKFSGSEGAELRKNFKKRWFWPFIIYCNIFSIFSPLWLPFHVLYVFSFLGENWSFETSTGVIFNQYHDSAFLLLFIINSIMHF